MTRWRAAVGGGLVGLAALLATGPAVGQKTATKKTAKGKSEVPPLNTKVLEFARSKVGEQVGDGECWSLANAAVLAAGGKSSPSYKDSPAKGDYVWGELVYGAAASSGTLTEEPAAGKKAVLPGDIIQFRDAKFSGPRPGGGTYGLTAPHHTAVVTAVAPDGRTFQVLHQNFAGKRTVGDATITVRDLKDGWIKVYRPLPR